MDIIGVAQTPYKILYISRILSKNVINMYLLLTEYIILVMSTTEFVS